jgi:Xaa-Pro aminopeptidase
MSTDERIDRIQSDLQASGLDALLVVSAPACTYLSGCHLLTQTAIPDREAYVLIPARGEPSYLVCSLELGSAQAESRVTDIHTYVEFETLPAQAAADMLAARGLSTARVAYEARAMRAHSLQVLGQALPGASWQACDDQIHGFWTVKSEPEIQALREAGLATERAISDGLTAASPGVSERQLATRVYSGMQEAGISPMFDVFAAGPNMFTVHAIATERIPQAGELIRLDMGGRAAGSHVLSDMARTAVVGEPSARQADMLAKLAEVQALVAEACEVGRPVSDLFHLCAQGFKQRGLPFGMPHIGHSLGIDLHEAPIIRPGNGAVLQAGTVLNIEPFLALPEQGETYHVEDLVLVSEAGPKWLTTPQSELIQVPV